MKAFCESLKQDMEQQLALLHTAMPEPLQHSEQAIVLLIEVLDQLKKECLQYRFESNEEEIAFFRDLKPHFAGRLLYYHCIHTIESKRPFDHNKAIRRYYRAEQEAVREFFGAHAEFCHYMRRGLRYADEYYFLRGGYDIRFGADITYLQSDKRFSTPYDYLAARIIANELLLGYLQSQAELFSNKETRQPTAAKNPKAQWTGSKAALTELVYALHTEGVFNNGNIGLGEIASCFESAFHVELGQFHRIFLEIRGRKSERAKFLCSMRDKLIKRMDDADG